MSYADKLFHLKTPLLISLLLSAVLFLAACSPSSTESTADKSPEVLIFSGGEWHDFERWFVEEDSKIMTDAGANVRSTNDPNDVLPALSDIDILNINTNQAIDIPEFPDRIIEFVEEGNSLFLVHAASWYIWDWPEYYKNLIGGGTSSHGPLGEFEVYVTDTEHPLMAGVPERFRITDELYRFQRNEEGSDMHVLAVGIEPDTGDEYPVKWTVDYGDGRVVVTTLGHDGDAHQHEAFVTFMQNTVRWLH
ncbi:ThuA domain-containing protein [Marinimicrobium alkaliphilum]|uniref:ThuA domain-containing protein n=1 Tax=Marinimicrobium alkaliphilum TaxID=2202654 RepID=UPI000DB9BCAB|nr:ThuA domain-containing protein [Marinimicrobium alkaliphilum]